VTSFPHVHLDLERVEVRIRGGDLSVSWHPRISRQRGTEGM
jgi:hypothetical protein